MNNFINNDDLTNQFKDGQLSTLPEAVVVGGTTFTYSTEYNITMERATTLPHNPKYTVIYEHNDDFIAFTWCINKQLHIVPTAVNFLQRPINEVNDRDIARHYDEKTIGKSLEVVLMGLNGNQPIKCKVDTGAELCSLDAQDIKVMAGHDGQQVVKFTFDDKIYTVNLQQQQAVQTADGGVNYRPVVKLSIKVNGQVYSDVLFNLNDRSDMPNPILLGINFLEKTDYFIDPKKESIDYPTIEDVLVEFDKHSGELVVEGSDTIVEYSTKEEQMKALLEAIYTNPAITLADIIRHMKSDTLKVLDNIQY